MQDPDDGAAIIRAVYKRDDIYSGPFLHNAAELQVGMNEGYRVSWQTTLGGSPPGIVYKNDRKWSADHGGYDFAITSGIFVTSRPINTADAAHHRHRADRAALLRPLGSDGHRWQTALLTWLTAMSCSLEESKLREGVEASPSSTVPSGLLRPSSAEASARVRDLLASSARRASRWRRPPPTARRPRRSRNAPPTGSRRCSVRRSRSRPRSAACSPNSASWRSIARSRWRSSTQIERDAADVQAKLAIGGPAGGGAPGRSAAPAPGRRSAARAAVQDGPRRLLAPAARRQQPARRRARLPHGRGARADRSRSRGGAPADAGGADEGARHAPGARRGAAHAASARPATRARRVERAVTARANLVASIDTRRDLNAQLTGELQDAQRKLQATLAQSPPDARPPRRRSADAAVPGSPAVAGGGGPVGPFRTPAAGDGRPAGPQRHRTLAARRTAGHTPSTRGRWRLPSLFSGYGILVIVDHGDQIYTLYGHLGSAAVHKGDRVEAGDNRRAGRPQPVRQSVPVL